MSEKFKISIIEEEENKEESEKNQKNSTNDVNKLKNEIEMLKSRQHDFIENIEKIKELQSLLEKERKKSHAYMTEIKEYETLLVDKNQEIQRLSDEKFSTPVKTEKSDSRVDLLKEIKSKLDSIIENLSKPNDSKNLLKVSKDLLTLQETVAVNLKNYDDRINSLVSEKNKNSINGSKSHKHTNSTNFSPNTTQTEPSEIKPSNFNIYKAPYNY